MGVGAEALRRHAGWRRFLPPSLSFAGVNADEVLAAQTMEEPLGPVRGLADEDADVLLLGTDHRSDVSLHWAERLAGRKQFLRWALTPSGVAECPAYPGCPDGFEAIRPHLAGIARQTQLGDDLLQAFPVRDLIHVAVAWIRQDVRALLCHRQGGAPGPSRSALAPSPQPAVWHLRHGSDAALWPGESRGGARRPTGKQPVLP